MSKPMMAAVLLCLLGAGARAQPLAQSPAQTQPLPQGREPGTAPYDPFSRSGATPAPAVEPSPSGFRITVPMCRQAEHANDPLAKTPECATLLNAAQDQAKACRQAFENGDDKAALSDACRQAAGFR